MNVAVTVRRGREARGCLERQAVSEASGAEDGDGPGAAGGRTEEADAAIRPRKANIKKRGIKCLQKKEGDQATEPHR